MNLINPSCETFGRFASFGEHLAHDAEFYGGEGRRQEEEEEEEEGNGESTAVIHNSDELHITAKLLKSAVSYNFDIYLRFLPRKQRGSNEMRAIYVCQALCIRSSTRSGDVHDRQPV